MMKPKLIMLLSTPLLMFAILEYSMAIHHPIHFGESLHMINKMWRCPNFDYLFHASELVNTDRMVLFEILKKKCETKHRGTWIKEYVMRQKTNCKLNLNHLFVYRIAFSQPQKYYCHTEARGILFSFVQQMPSHVVDVAVITDTPFKQILASYDNNAVSLHFFLEIELSLIIPKYYFD